MRSRSRSSRALLAIALCVAPLSMGLSAGPSGPLRCSYEGAPAFELLVDARKNGGLSIRRSGREIVIRSDFVSKSEDRRKVVCSGGTPTVDSTDQITVTGSGEGPRLHLSLEPVHALAPGATPEPDGSSEIEISGPFVLISVVGTVANDELRAGSIGGRRTGLSLSAERPKPEVDVFAGRRTFLRLLGGGGRDLLDLRGAGPAFAGPDEGSGLLVGGPGRDRIRGGDGTDLVFGRAGDDVIATGPGRDYIWDGPGRDRVLSGPGDDVLFGGRGRDRLIAGPGDDDLFSGDRNGDRLSCGFGRDRARADARDALRSCRRRPGLLPPLVPWFP